MADGVGIVGAGYEGFRPAVTDLSTRELMFQAASKAYADADVDPRKDVGSFICCTEDLWEGWSIADEMVPDQIGGARRPLFTVAGDGLTGIGHAVMHIRAGVADVVAVESHSKAADVLDKYAVENMALDPTYQRVPGVNPDILAGLEMSGFLHESGFTRDAVSDIVVAAKRRALKNSRASYGARLSRREVSNAEPIATPLRKFDKAEFADAGIVVVLASEKWIKKRKAQAVKVDGVAWRSSTPWFEGGKMGVSGYAQQAYKAVQKQSRVRGLEGFDVLEVDDTYSYKLVQHLLSMAGGREKAKRILDGKGPALNPSGGSLGCGNLIEATGLHRALECVLQLRGEAGGCQVGEAKRALAMSWRGNPTGSGAALALSNGGFGR